ncbi:acyl-CoA synthetase (AMP-forming)/AMP-acid ligase II [Actinocorallia herbida]|uniref:Acyl-CoA synthetase (AMP-forming)/AMP-acid ligase II n=1 Tax=Actinocorallia herbida TaxID=58109 RepID=A0A3N1D6P3_9ACTN|nr:AMP-binding protein [Actinocorallia herbida]ROO89207.1 acyl-CoA synthetase (AMP-forming)/AMP-acid ligase II [Actinocorallia herbida]
MVHARPAYRPGLRRRFGHSLDYLHVLGSGALRLSRPLAALRGVGELQTWGTTLGGLVKAAAAMQPRKTAVLDDTGSLTYAELDERTDLLAAALPLDGPRPKVAVMCRNHRGLVEILVACAKRGAETVLLNTGFGLGQLRSVLDELRPAVVVADPEFARLLGDCPAALAPVVVWAGPEAQGETLDALIERAPRGALQPPHTDGRTIMLSSGTSGRPKGARRKPRPGMGPLASMLSRIPLRSRHTFLIDAPVFHTWGLAALQIGLALRATIVLHRRFDPSLTLGELERHSRVAHFAVPVMVQRIMELPETVLDGYDTRNLRLTALSGSSLPGDLADRFMDAFGDRLYNVYGSTEASWVSVAGPKELRINPATAGRPPRGTSVRILDAEGKPVPRATIGRIFAANENVFEGYTGGDPTEVRDGLLSTGDLGHLDSHGLLYVDGREDGMVVSGGENVVPRDVEDVLARLPEVREVAVTGVADPEYGQRLAAYLVLRPGADLTEQEVREHVRTRVARFAVPRDIVFIDELPRNATGKIVYRWLSGLASGRTHPPEGRVHFWHTPNTPATARPSPPTTATDAAS